MFAIAGALLGLILLLATLQYRWLGQISGAERERMTATLNTRAAAFGEDFDRELTRAYLLFQLDPMQQDQSAAAGIVTRYDRWQATARFPQMIKDVFVVPSAAAVNESGLLQRFNPSTRFLEPADWPASLAGIRKLLVDSRAQRERDAGDGRDAIDGADGLAGRAGAGGLGAARDAQTSRRACAGSDVVPEHDAGPPLYGAPARRRLHPAAKCCRRSRSSTSRAPATASTTSSRSCRRPVLRRGSSTTRFPSSCPAPESAADAKVELFQVRVKDFEPLVNEVSRFATFTAQVPQHMPATRQPDVHQSRR